MSLTPCGGMLCAEEIDSCNTCERERMAGTPTPPLAMLPIYLDADDEGEMMQMMQLQDFIAQLEQEHEQHQQSAQSIEQRLARLRDFQRLCRKFQFWGQNPKTRHRQFNDLQTTKLSKKQICDRAVVRRA
jgi:hypothetical protein